MFNPAPACETRQLGNGSACVLIDEALAEPGALVDLAVRHREAFADSGRAFPGVELPLPDMVAEALAAYVLMHAAASLGVTEVLSAHGRLGMVTRPPGELRPIQCVCHRDRLFVDDGERAVAAVLYLFRDPAMGGTNFFRPLLPTSVIDERMQRWATMSPQEWQQEAGQPPGYLIASNRWFELADVIDARWNRLVVYDGGCFHGSHIARPELLSDAPDRGRLTINLFMRCRAGPAR